MSAVLKAFSNLINGYTQKTCGPRLTETTTLLALVETNTGRALTETT